MKSKRIKDIKIGDQVIGPNGTVSVIDIIKEYIPLRMFKMKFDIGTVECSDNHLWVVYKQDKPYTLTTLEVFLNKGKGYSFGEKDGPKLLDMKEIRPKKVCCINIESEDKLFALDLAGGRLFTHNCQFRAACGRLGSIASMMLFGNTIATTIDGSHPGAGMISANGSVSSVQYYFEDVNWIQGFYKTCGFDNTGHRSVDGYKEKTEEIEELVDEETYTDEDLQDLDSIFNFEHDIAKIEIEGISGEVDKTKRQQFDN